MSKGWLGRLQQGRKSWCGSTYRSNIGGTIWIVLFYALTVAKLRCLEPPLLYANLKQWMLATFWLNLFVDWEMRQQSFFAYISRKRTFIPHALCSTGSFAWHSFHITVSPHCLPICSIHIGISGTPQLVLIVSSCTVVVFNPVVFEWKDAGHCITARCLTT